MKQGESSTYLRNASESLGYSAEQLGKFADRLAKLDLLAKKLKVRLVNGRRCTYYQYNIAFHQDYFELTYRDYDFLVKLGTTELALGACLMESYGSAEYSDTSGRKLSIKWNMDHKTVLKSIEKLEASKFLKRIPRARGFSLEVSPRFVSYKWEIENGEKHYVTTIKPNSGSDEVTE